MNVAASETSGAMGVDQLADAVACNESIGGSIAGAFSLTFNKGKANEYRALEHASMKVRRGEFFCLLGPSGCGKSTIFNLIAGFARPDGRHPHG